MGGAVVEARNKVLLQRIGVDAFCAENCSGGYCHSKCDDVAFHVSL